MKEIIGLYTTLTVMMFVILVNVTLFNAEYSGIAMYVCLGLFLVGTLFFLSAKQKGKLRSR
ncbi:hypothetical protein DNH61_24370 [Paenibacillus sambharensis]|uniref:Uncharacterized protein n=1 Tax=Paenibacillus sambharensis TaxID=1803190 RepID=A0A2W1LDP3_9BACL|nr:hypothetical protein [Paenibacillus sambharensis]PZD93185.1 hypothetical protein DNH61_24370 [Paenibacillus sambharensis]